MIETILSRKNLLKFGFCLSALVVVLSFHTLSVQAQSAGLESFGVEIFSKNRTFSFFFPVYGMI